MTQKEKEALFEKNRRLIEMVIRRAERDFPGDIALIGLTGSFATGDYHEKSDLDFIIVNDTPRGWGISSCFILGDVGYDIYCTPWSPRLTDAAELCSPMISHLVELEVLWCPKAETREKFETLQKKALQALSQPLGEASLERGFACIERAKTAYADGLLAGDIGAKRYCAGGLLLACGDALMALNNAYYHFGVKRHLEELLALRYVPQRFEERYNALIFAPDAAALGDAARELLQSLTELYARMRCELLEKPVPTAQTLPGSYEELWCNYRNKLLLSCSEGDAAAAFYAAVGAQDFLNEMERERGTPHFDLLSAYDPEDLSKLRERFLAVSDGYLQEYRKCGIEPLVFDTLEALEAYYLRK